MKGETALPLDWTRVKRRRNDEASEKPCDPINCPARRHGPRLVQGGIQGHVIFCLHEINPDWFQGYFTPLGTRRPWGLLAEQEEIDDCLACADGGFRRVSLTVYPPSGKPVQLATIDWTGGDLIHLRHENLEVESDRIWTGKSSLRHVDSYFKGLIRRLRQQYEVNEDEPILDWLPDIATISGNMTIAMKKNETMEANDA